MRILLDVNVVLDVLLARSPFDFDAVRVLEVASQEGFTACVCADSISTIYYICRRHKLAHSDTVARLKRFLAMILVVPVTDIHINAALASSLPDLEDAILLQSALGAGCDAIVTRDPAGFAGAALKVLSPLEVLEALSGE